MSLDESFLLTVDDYWA